MEIYDLDYNKRDLLISSLSLNLEDNIKAIEEYYKNFKIEKDRFLVISDTHFGRSKCDIYLMDKIYNYAINNNIDTIIHAGDLVEGKSNPYMKNLSIEEQIKNFIKYYPNDLVKTYYLYGNHDFNCYYYDKVDLKEYLKELKNLEYIGVKNSYIYLNDNSIIKVEHKCKTCNYLVPKLEYDFKIYGHKHSYGAYSEASDIRLPALILDNPDNIETGFLDVTLDLGNLIVNFYNNDINHIKEDVVCKRKVLKCE